MHLFASISGNLKSKISLFQLTMFRANTDVHHFLDKKYGQKRQIQQQGRTCVGTNTKIQNVLAIYKKLHYTYYLHQLHSIISILPPFSGNLTNGCCWEIIWFTMMGFSLLYSSLLNHAKLARLKQSRKAIVAAPFYFPYSIPQSSSEYICKIMSS